MRHTRTSKYLSDGVSSWGYDGVHIVPRVYSPPGSMFRHRLSFAGTPKGDYDVADLCDYIARHFDDALFFCDTSVFNLKTDRRIWSTLLGRRGKVVITSHVLSELETWIARHPTDIVAKAIVDKDPHIEFASFGGKADWENTALEYYVFLLGLRKRLVRVEEIKFEDKHGRPPNEREVAKLKQKLHEEIGPRGYVLARKGAEKTGSPDIYADEVLVTLAMMTAIMSGQQVVIMSKDEDIQEQFYKLQWLLDTHYRGMLLADLYASDPLSFRIHGVPTDIPDVSDMFTGEDKLLIERSEQLLEDILPPSFESVPIYCWTLGEKLSEMTFVAEREMSRLLEVKGQTKGLNTDRLAGRNCHIWLAPIDFPYSLRGCALIARDRRLQAGRSLAEIPVFDGNQAVYCAEQFKRIVAL